MSVSLSSAGGRMEPAEPQPLFLLGLGATGEIQFHRHPYDVSPDGQRFLVSVPSGEPASSRVTVVLNWTALLPR